jgi:hypothetical protein
MSNWISLDGAEQNCMHPTHTPFEWLWEDICHICPRLVVWSKDGAWLPWVIYVVHKASLSE